MNTRQMKEVAERPHIGDPEEAKKWVYSGEGKIVPAETYGTPRMEPVIKKLVELHGAVTQAMKRAGEVIVSKAKEVTAGLYSIEVGNPLSESELAELREQIEKYSGGLQRFLCPSSGAVMESYKRLDRFVPIEEDVQPDVVVEDHK